eukprot:TRINITY_DN50914_c0_g1_i1.p1 TRINITY_DN50914_c0_g1~~TRINITY_DN50914_c0_g1_i1.p1  ORF type:complete len:288 (+),score=52.86 TRINITY_DN50914_c0_g1_i1:37-864(+)
MLTAAPLSQHAVGPRCASACSTRGSLVTRSAWQRRPVSFSQQLLGGAAWAAQRCSWMVQDACAQLTPATSTLVFLALLLGGVLGLGAGRYRRIKTELDITTQDVRKKRCLSGQVVSVADGDTIRVRHRPLWARLRPLPKFRRKSEETISIRVAAVDAPEVSHQGKEAQPFSKESKEFTASQTLDKHVSIKVLSRDQYGRIVAKVMYGMWPFRKNLSKQLLQRGLAAIYRSSGAEIAFEGEQDVYERIEAAAKKRKLGMWSLGKKLVLPRDYKADK